MSKFKVGDKVVCTAKERPFYFNSSGLMDYMLDRKTVLEVAEVFHDSVIASAKNDILWTKIRLE